MLVLNFKLKNSILLFKVIVMGYLLFYIIGFEVDFRRRKKYVACLLLVLLQESLNSIRYMKGHA